jgi:hypothetical protein
MQILSVYYRRLKILTSIGTVPPAGSEAAAGMYFYEELS